MTYEETMAYLEGLGKTGSVPGPTNIRNLLERLNNPQDELQFIHIAGTNGKGSVSEFTAEILMAAGYHIGRYVSPALQEYRERFQLDGGMITEADLIAYAGKVKQAADSMQAEGLTVPTIFEFETALTFLYFRDKKCDLVVLETGMGGRLDATNIVKNTALEIFTSISMDHMEYLGNTLTEIAGNKAGIIKPGSLAVSDWQPASAAAVLEREAWQQDCPLAFLDRSEITDVHSSLKEQSFSFRKFRNLKIHLAGLYQVENAALSVLAALALRKCGYRIPEDAVRSGLERAQWFGRFSVLEEKPLLIADGAHNPDGARKLADSVKFYFTNRRIIYIMGVLKDKDYRGIMKETAVYADRIITLTPPNPRGLPAAVLAQSAGEAGKEAAAAGSVHEALQMAEAAAGPDDIILAARLPVLAGSAEAGSR